MPPRVPPVGCASRAHRRPIRRRLRRRIGCPSPAPRLSCLQGRHDADALPHPHGARGSDELRYDTGYLPQFHLLKLEDGDLRRLFIPVNMVDRCSLLPGHEVALIDCLGRTSTAFVESCADVFYIGCGWKESLKLTEAVKGDYLLFKFVGARTYKVVVFNGRFGWQRYPFVEEQYQDMVFHPREPKCFYSSG